MEWHICRMCTKPALKKFPKMLYKALYKEKKFNKWHFRANLFFFVKIKHMEEIQIRVHQVQRKAKKYIQLFHTQKLYSQLCSICAKWPKKKGVVFVGPSIIIGTPSTATEMRIFTHKIREQLQQTTWLKRYLGLFATMVTCRACRAAYWKEWVYSYAKMRICATSYSRVKGALKAWSICL